MKWTKTTLGLLACAVVLSGCGAVTAPSRGQQRRDLAYVATALEQDQGSLQGNEVRMRQFKRFAANVIAATRLPTSRWRLALAAERITMWFADAHTDLIYTLLASPSHIPLQFYWARGGLIVIGNQDKELNVKPADQVVAIGKESLPGVEHQMQAWLPLNKHGVRYTGAELLSTSGMLHWLGAVTSHSVLLRIRRPNGSEYTASVPVERGKAPLSNYAANVDEVAGLRLPWIESDRILGYAWGIAPDNNYGLLRLYECSPDESLDQALFAFFHTVNERHVPNVVIDLQGNPGGIPTIVNSVLAYLPAPKQVVMYQDETMANPAPAANEPVFRGHVYVVIDGGTESSAIMLADVLAANHLATLVGAPTGSSPSFHMALVFDSPGALEGEVGVGPLLDAPLQGEGSALTPELTITPTVREIQLHRDLLAQWANSLR